MNIAKKVAKQEARAEAVARRTVAKELKRTFKANTKNEYSFKVEKNVTKYYIIGEGMRLECSRSSFRLEQVVKVVLTVLVKFGFCIKSQVPYQDQFGISSGVVIRAYLPK